MTLSFALELQKISKHFGTFEALSRVSLRIRQRSVHALLGDNASANMLQYLFKAMGWNLPYQIFLALPYGLILCGLAAFAGRVHAPASLGKWV